MYHVRFAREPSQRPTVVTANAESRVHVEVSRRHGHVDDVPLHSKYGRFFVAQSSASRMIYTHVNETSTICCVLFILCACTRARECVYGVRVWVAI